MPQRTLRWVWSRGAGLHRTWLRSGWSGIGRFKVCRFKLMSAVCGSSEVASTASTWWQHARGSYPCPRCIPLWCALWPEGQPEHLAWSGRFASEKRGRKLSKTQQVDSGDCTTSLLHHPWIPSQICQQHLLKSLLFKLLQFRRNAVEPGIQ